jgi:hypothetical protein
MMQMLAQLAQTSAQLNSTQEQETRTPGGLEQILPLAAGAYGANRLYQYLTKPGVAGRSIIPRGTSIPGIGARAPRGGFSGEGFNFEGDGLGFSTGKTSFGPNFSDFVTGGGSGIGSFSGTGGSGSVFIAPGAPTAGTPDFSAGMWPFSPPPAPSFTAGVSTQALADPMAGVETEALSYIPPPAIPGTASVGDIFDDMFTTGVNGASGASGALPSINFTPSLPGATPLPSFDFSSAGDLATSSGFGLDPAMLRFSSVPVGSSAAAATSGFSGAATGAVPGASSAGFSGSLAGDIPSYSSGFSSSAPGSLTTQLADDGVNALSSSSAGVSGAATATWSPPIVGPAISLATAGRRGEGGRSAAVGQVAGSAIGSLAGPAGATAGQIIGALIGETVGDMIVKPLGDALYDDEGNDLASKGERVVRRTTTKVGDVVADAASTVICTELYRQGLLTRRQYLSEFRRSYLYYSKTSWEGYQAWGKPMVRWMQKSPRVTKFWLKIALSRMELAKGHITAYGLLAELIVTPSSYLLGTLLKGKRALSRKFSKQKVLGA